MNSVPIVSVVDDDVSVLKGLARLCRAWGFAVRPFTSAQQFLEHLRAEGDEIGCIVLDVHLPGMSGLELQAELASIQLDIPIVFVTGAGDDTLRSRALADGAVAFLEKPFDQADLLHAVQDAVARPRHAGERRGYFTPSVFASSETSTG
jgi:FixJ family two-component response regulator